MIVQPITQNKSGTDIKNIKDAEATGALNQIFDGEAAFDFTGKNPNATALDSTLTGSINKGATGQYASSFGGKSAAIGKRSHAEGTTTIAKGAYSHAEGDNSVSLGDDSHAEGYITVAKGGASHSEGSNTQAIGNYSHAEGNETTAFGMGSHSEGFSTEARGNSAHAEGNSTIAKGKNSHAEGNNVLANGDVSHIEGGCNTSGFYALGKISNYNSSTNTITITDKEGSFETGFRLGVLVMGANKSVSDYTSFVGSIKSVSDNSIVLENIKTDLIDKVVAGSYVYISSRYDATSDTGSGGSGGDGSTTNPTVYSTSGEYAHAEGVRNIALGRHAHVEGNDSVAQGDSSHAEGNSTIAIGLHSHSEGSNTQALGIDSHAEGYKTKAVEQGAHAEGVRTSAKELGAHAEGNETQATYKGSHAEGIRTNSTGAGSHTEGVDTSATSESSHAEGTQSQALFIAAHAEGNNTKAKGMASHSEGTGTLASGDYSHAEGNQTEARNGNSHSEGSGTIAASDNQHVQGKFNIIDTENKYADIVGNGTGSSDRSNAYTLDWEGNANFSGTVSSNSKELATKEYVDSKILSSGEETTEKTITATYSGTAETGAVWAKAWGTTNIMVKVAESPSSNVNSIKNASISGIRVDNSYLNYTVPVTDSMIDSSNTGVIFINYQNQTSERNAITRAAVVYIAGTYNNFDIDGSTGIDITFTEPGVYLLDNHTSFGGNDYTSKFVFTAVSSGTGTIDPIDYTGNEIQMFNNIICIGDSVTEGAFDEDNSYPVYKTYSYPANLRKMVNATVTNAGIAGVTSTQWYQAALDSTTYNGQWNADNEWEWTSKNSALNFKGYDAAIIHLGINDVLSVTESNTIDTVVSNFNTAINNIVGAIKAGSSGGTAIFLCTIIPNYVNGSYWEAINNKIKEKVNPSSGVYLIDLTKYSKILNGTDYEVNHPTKTGYNELAKEIYALVSYTISQNLSNFNTISTNVINNRQTGADYATKNYVDSKIDSENSNIFKGIINISNGNTIFNEVFSIALTEDFKNAGRVLTEYLDFEYNITCNNSNVNDGSFEPDFSLSGTMINDKIISSGGTNINGGGDLKYYYTISNGEPIKITFILSNSIAYGNTINVEIVNKGLNTVVDIPTVAQYTAPTSTVYDVPDRYGITQSQIDKLNSIADSYMITMEGTTTDGTTSVELKGNKDAITDVIAKKFLNSDNRLTVPRGTICDAEITVFCAQASTNSVYLIGNYTTAFHLKTSGITNNVITCFANRENNESINFTTNGMTDITTTTLSVKLKASTTYNQIMVTGLADTIMKWKAFVKISNIFTPEFE